MSVNLDQIGVSDKFNYYYEDYKYFIGYQEGEIFQPLCIILPQMSVYIKYFECRGMSISFFNKNDKAWGKYKQI